MLGRFVQLVSVAAGSELEPCVLLSADCSRPPAPACESSAVAGVSTESKEKGQT